MAREKLLLLRFQIFITVMTFGYIVLITVADLPETGVEFAKIVLPFLLGTVVGTVVAYNWGTSASSALKTDMLSRTGPVPEEDCPDDPPRRLEPEARRPAIPPPLRGWMPASPENRPSGPPPPPVPES